MSPQDARKAMRLLDAMDEHATWTTAKRDLLLRAQTYMERGGNYCFDGDCRTHGLPHVGDYMLLSEDARPKGDMEIFRGLRFLMVCIGNGG